MRPSPAGSGVSSQGAHGQADRISTLRNTRAFAKLCDIAKAKRRRSSKMHPDGFLIPDEEANARTFMRELRQAGYSVNEVKREIER